MRLQVFDETDVRALLHDYGAAPATVDAVADDVLALTHGEPLFARFVSQEVASGGTAALKRLTRRVPAGVEDYFRQEFDLLRHKLYAVVLDPAFRHIQIDSLGDISATLDDLRAALALRADDIVKILACAGAYRDTLRRASLALSILDRIDQPDFDQALKHARLCDRTLGWARVMWLYLAWCAALIGKADAARHALATASELSSPQADLLCDALLVRTAGALATAKRDAQAWLVEFGRAGDAEQLLGVFTWNNHVDWASDTAKRIRADAFRSERHELVDAYRSWQNHPDFSDIPTAIGALDTMADRDQRLAYVEHLAARWACPTAQPNMDGLKRLIPLALSDSTLLDAVLARLVGSHLHTLNDAALVEACAQCMEYLASGRPWELGWP